MIIGFDGSRAFNLQKTGTENYSYQLLKHLSLIDQKNHYIIFVRPNTNVPTNWPKNFSFQLIKLSKLWTQVGLSKETFFKKIDLLFVPAHTIPIVRKRGLKTIITVHDLGSEYLPKTHQLKQRLYLSFMQKYQLKNATFLIAVSKATKEDLVKKVGCQEKKIEVIYEGYDEKLFTEVKNDRLDSILRQYEIEKDSYFLFVGTVQPRKNLERLILAFSKFITQTKSTPKLVIVGSKGWLSDQVYELPKNLEIEKRVKFLNFVPNEHLPALYSGALALTFPSLFEGFGLPIIEAQACGCPVLTSNLSSMPEVAGPPAGGGAILVDPYSAEEITSGMIKVMDKKVRGQLIEAGFENIKRFSWEKCARQTLKVIEEVGK